MNVTLLGTGLMGAPMARRLCAAPDLAVTVWNRTREKALPLAGAGATVAETLAEAVACADAVITMVDHGAAVADLVFDQGAAAAMRPGSVLIDMSSIKPREARVHAERLAALGIEALDAPVSGGTVGAAAGTLAIMVGGESATFERMAPVFAPLGRATHVGPTGAGQLAKLANQMIVGITIGAVAEALLLAEAGGASPAGVRQAIRGGFAESRILEVHGERMVGRDFARRAALTVQLKDMRNALETAREMGLALPVTGLFERLYASGAEHGFADLDHSALFLEIERQLRL